MIQDSDRQVKGIWIPIEIWKDPNLSWNERILFAEIDSLTSKDRDCCFSNEYIAELLGVSTYNASRALNHLIELGYVIRTRFDGRRRFIRSAFSYMKEDTKAGLPKTASLPLEELPKTASQGCRKEQGCVAENSNIINNTINKELNNKKENVEKEIDFVNEDMREMFLEFLAYRKKIGRPLKPVSYRKTYEQLIELSNGDYVLARRIIDQTIANGWQGLFKLKLQPTKNANERTDENLRVHVTRRDPDTPERDDFPF